MKKGRFWHIAEGWTPPTAQSTYRRILAMKCMV